jgi:hypothetical protein
MVCGITEIAWTQAPDSSQVAQVSPVDRRLAQAGGAQAPAPEATYDVTPRRLTVIPPGTVIDKGAPKGWSHLLVKARSKVGAGDLNMMTPETTHLASFLFSAVVANVQEYQVAGQKRFRLADVAVGIGTRIRDQDVIISGDTQRKLGANLGFLERLGLGRAESRLTQVEVVARSPTMILFDSPTQVFRDGRHVGGVMRNAVLVSETTGQLTALVWFVSISDRGEYSTAVKAFELMPMNRIEEYVLHIDGREFALGVITEKAIALNALPTGSKQFPIPDTLVSLVGRKRFSREMAREVETQLRAIVKASDR